MTYRLAEGEQFCGCCGGSLYEMTTELRYLGAADDVNVAMASLYGVSFMTVDNRLVNNIIGVRSEIESINYLYFYHAAPSDLFYLVST